MAQTNLRIPDELYDKVRQRAKDSGRSINSQILFELDRYPVATFDVSFSSFGRYLGALLEMRENLENEIDESKE